MIDQSQFPFFAGKLVCNTEEAMRALDVGRTKFWALVNSGQLETYVDGRSRKVSVPSIFALINKRLRVRTAKDGNRGHMRMMAAKRQRRINPFVQLETDLDNINRSAKEG